MPLTIAELNKEYTIKRISGASEVRSHLENLGFVAGGTVTVISTVGGNLIVNVKGTRIALDRALAQKIFV